MRLLWSVLLLIAFVPGWSGDAPNSHIDPHARFTLMPVQLRADGGRRVGQLTFLRGYRLTSADRVFGGFSSLMVDGKRFTLLSDNGEIVRFDLDAKGQVASPWIGRLPGGPGNGWLKQDRDSESMATDPVSGDIWVGFERWNEIWRYSPGFGRAERGVAPRAMAGWAPNNGPESVVRLRSGGFLVFAEDRNGPDGKTAVALRFAGDPTTTRTPPQRFYYRPPESAVPSDAAELPDGRIALLNRQVSLKRGFEVIVTTIDPAAIRPGATVIGTPIARFSGEVLHDNYEGIAVGREGGRPVLWIVSDDNQSIFQQSLLLEFAFQETQKAPPQGQGQ